MKSLTDALVQSFKAGHPCVRVATLEEEDAVHAVRAAAMAGGVGGVGGVGGGLQVVEWSAVRGLADGLLAPGTGGAGASTSPSTGTEHPAAALLAMAALASGHAGPGGGAGGRAIFLTLDLAPHLGDPRTLRAWRELVGVLAARNEAMPAGPMSAEAARQFGGGHLVMIDAPSSAGGGGGGDVPGPVVAYSTLIEPPLPDRAEAEDVIRRTLRRLNKREPIQVELTRTALDTVVRSVAGLSRRQIERVIVEVVSEDRRFDEHDIRKVLTGKRKALASEGVLEYVEAPATLDRVGGLKNVKAWLARRHGALSAEAGQFGLTPPRGVLLLGVQGAGKSLCAKAIATAWNRLLLRLDAGALYDKYIGESEKRLRQALHQAEAVAPVVLWIDEIEKAFAGAGSTSNDGGLSRRMFGSLLTWMQEHRSNVFLVATANDIEALPPELLRKGRFDEIFFIDLPTEPVRREIVSIHLARRRRDPAKFDLAALAAASEGFSGAEIEQAIMSALYDAFAAGKELDTASIERAMRDSPPLSVTMAERLEALRRWGRERCVPAD